jgi:DNA-binding transcriptional LysR family regulator
MTLLQLRVLLAVADHGGFTVAAEQVGMSQPAVSRAIASLESELGTALLHRHRDGVRLTEAGRRAVGHAREALRHFDLLRVDVAALAGQVTGTLRLASLPSATGTLVAAQLRTFTDRYPRVRVRLFEGSDQEVRDWLEQGVADLGVVTLPAPGLRTIALGSHHMLAVLPAEHPLAASPVIGIEQLADQPFILSTGGCAPVILTAARAAGIRLNVAYEAREMSAVLEMVAAGLGVSMLPDLGLPAVLDSVVTRPLDPPACRSLAVALGAKAADSPAARAFAEQISGGSLGSAA